MWSPSAVEHMPRLSFLGQEPLKGPKHVSIPRNHYHPFKPNPPFDLSLLAFANQLVDLPADP
jgi:hypothetical protein